MATFSPGISTAVLMPPSREAGAEWCAVLDDRNRVSSDPIGFGSNEGAAVRDLLDQLGTEPAFAQARPVSLFLSAEALRWLDATVEAAVAVLLRAQAAAQAEGHAGNLREAVEDVRFGGMILAAVRSARR